VVSARYSGRVAPYLFVGLADLLRDDEALLDAVAAAYPPRLISWGRYGGSRTMLTISRTAFGQPIDVYGARENPDHRGLVMFTVDVTDIDIADDRTVRKVYRKITGAALDLVASVRPMLLAMQIEFGVDNLLDAPADDAPALFGSGWACVDRMDERRAAGFRRALADTEHRQAAGGVSWSGASPQTAERLRKAWVRDREPPGNPHRRHG
jgi:hypothetical protein